MPNTACNFKIEPIMGGINIQNKTVNAEHATFVLLEDKSRPVSDYDFP